VIGTGELTLPASGLVYVYLDLEGDEPLTPDYWAGWANAVHSFALQVGPLPNPNDPFAVNQVLMPFEPALYVTFDVHFYPLRLRDDRALALDTASTAWPHDAVFCHGLATPQPFGCVPNCSQGFHNNLTQPQRDFTQFAVHFQQLWSGLRLANHVLMWQYAESDYCVPACAPHDFATGLNIDMVLSNDRPDNPAARATEHMLMIA
jgi:hypothetical protein